jgi:hypothetical protein
MGIFNKTPQKINSEEFEKLCNELKLRDLQIEKLESHVNMMEAQLKSLRTRFNRANYPKDDENENNLNTTPLENLRRAGIW